MKLNIPGATVIEDVELQQKKTRAQKAKEAVQRETTGFPDIVYEPFSGVLVSPPSGLKAILETLGDPNPKKKKLSKGYKVDSSWASKYGTTVSSSQIAGYHRRIWMHKVVAPVFKEAMRRCSIALDEMGLNYKFRRIGCHNARHKRYNPELGWSVHTWAAAFDINPDTNKWAPVDAVPFGKNWKGDWKKYSDLPEVVVTIFENLGFEWGGRWTTSGKDTMHFQYARGY